jgi:hypothetical protein
VTSNGKRSEIERLKERCQEKLHRDRRTLIDGGQRSGSSGSEKYQNNEGNDEEKKRWASRDQLERKR